MNYIKPTTIQIVASFLLIALMSPGPAVASEFLSDLKKRADDACCLPRDSVSKQRMCNEYSGRYADEYDYDRRNTQKEWYLHCERRFLKQGIYRNCVCSHNPVPQNYGSTYPRTRIDANGLVATTLRSCNYWLCKNETRPETSEISATCLPFTSLLEYTRNAELSGGDSAVSSSGRSDSGVEGANASFSGFWTWRANCPVGNFVDKFEITLVSGNHFSGMLHHGSLHNKINGTLVGNRVTFDRTLTQRGKTRQQIWKGIFDTKTGEIHSGILTDPSHKPCTWSAKK
jgi:hypothetical protein